MPSVFASAAARPAGTAEAAERLRCGVDCSSIEQMIAVPAAINQRPREEGFASASQPRQQSEGAWRAAS